jgi:hypothetical protein
VNGGWKADSQDDTQEKIDQKVGEIEKLLFGGFRIAGGTPSSPFYLRMSCRCFEVSDAALYRHPNTAHCFYNKGTVVLVGVKTGDFFGLGATCFSLLTCVVLFLMLISTDFLVSGFATIAPVYMPSCENCRGLAYFFLALEQEQAESCTGFPVTKSPTSLEQQLTRGMMV